MWWLFRATHIHVHVQFILFAMFIDELYTCDCDVRGIQLLPNLTEIFLLMFADDIALIADTVVGLQRQLKRLYDFCQRSKVVVNITKTKIMVFERGGALARWEMWTFNNCKIEVVNGFTYVGLCFTNRLSMYQKYYMYVMYWCYTGWLRKVSYVYMCSQTLFEILASSFENARS